MTGESRSSWTANVSDHRSQRNVVVWSLIWVGAFLAGDFLIDGGSVQDSTVIVAITVLAGMLGVGWVRAYVRFIRQADELMRKIQLDAMAVALGAGFVVGFSLIMLGDAGLIEARISHVLVCMAAVYMLAVIIGLRRFGASRS